LTHDAADSDQGLPDWDEILERGDEEEKLERSQRRSRERKLQEEFAEKRVRVVDDLGRSYATGETVWRLSAPCPGHSANGATRGWAALSHNDKLGQNVVLRAGW
jgi:predicted metallo-beta-lactamase superfamily hydrolase